MSKYSGQNLGSLSPAEIKQWLDSFDTVLTDCDGVIWVDNNPLPGAPEVINRFIANGKKLFFVTNNSTKTRPEFVEKAVKLGFNVTIVSVNPVRQMGRKMEYTSFLFAYLRTTSYRLRTWRHST